MLLRNCNKTNKTQILLAILSLSVSIRLCHYQTFLWKEKKKKLKKSRCFYSGLLTFTLFFCAVWLLVWNCWPSSCPDHHKGHTACITYNWEAVQEAATSVGLQHTKGGGGNRNTFYLTNLEILVPHQQEHIPEQRSSVTAEVKCTTEVIQGTKLFPNAC